MSNSDIEKRIKILEEKKHSNSPILPGVVRLADTDLDFKRAMQEFESLPKGTPCILIEEVDASMPRPEKK
jgi:hypothetical protein